ncbi:MAG: hypothetical protein E6K27_05030 [Gammaproteobacteria bacterium]|nr:MAG: hypothetical protein E6K27_05030 [Gammaproteobacteria bacterium]
MEAHGPRARRGPQHRERRSRRAGRGRPDGCRSRPCRTLPHCPKRLRCLPAPEYSPRLRRQAAAGPRAACPRGYWRR